MNRRLLLAVWLVTLSGCRSAGLPNLASPPRWEKASDSICAGDTEGRILQAALASTAGPAFEGRIVTKGSDGTLHPVAGARISAYSYNFFVPEIAENWDPDTSYIEPSHVTTSADGAFHDATRMAQHVEERVCVQGAIVETDVPIATVFVVRAPNCLDQRVTFDSAWKPHDIVLKCKS
jgi:hypothetical protein